MIGRHAPRQDARLKVLGRARYVADLDVPGVLDGVFVTATIGAGRVTEIIVTDALAVAGVVAVLRAGDLPPIEPLDHGSAGQSLIPLMSDEIFHEGQPIALVVATSRIAAVEGASRVRVATVVTPIRAGFEALRGEGIEVKDWAPTRSANGSVDRGVGEADALVTATYHTADRHHAAMEPSAVIASWADDRLDVWTSTQWVYGARGGIAQSLGIPLEHVRVRTPFVGGGFGAKGSCWPHEILAAAASRHLARPVRIVLSRADTFTAHGYQPATAQELLLGARRDGTLTALRHLSWNAAAMSDDYVEHGSMGSRKTYACPNIETLDRIVRVNRPQPTFMRAPHEGPGMVGLEIAVDELATALGIDPVALRLTNYAEQDPTSAKPFSSKELRECYRIGAERFGWSRRLAAPGHIRDGNDLVGYGMATALMSTFRFGAAARVTIRRDGSALVESAAHEIGTGVRTMLAQVAADTLGTSIDRIEVSLGDTDVPEAGGTFGSATTLSVGSAVQVAARKLRARLEELAGEPGLEAREYSEVLALHRLDQIVEEGSWAPRREESGYAMNAYGAVFVEVRVGRTVPTPRVTRVVGVYSVGRVVNPRSARGQVTGGILWGLGQALTEESRIDPLSGRFVAKGFGGYHLPTMADAPAVEVEFVPEFDPHASLLGARGVGEIGTIGVGAAIANAVFNATGIRVRRLPIKIEDLLPTGTE